MEKMAETPKNITDLIVKFCVELKSNNIPNFTEQLLRLSVIDWIAVALAGSSEPASRLIRELEEETGGSDESVVIGMANRLPSRSAAFANGVAGHALDYDDTHFATFGHPTAVIIPASLAVTDRLKCNTEKFYKSALIGIELAIRIGIWLGKGHYLKGFHITSTAGAFGAAMAAAHILDLNTEQAKNAIGITASKASGIRAQFGTMSKPLHAGIAASNGLEAALLAEKGFEAAPNALEKEFGFGETHEGDFYENAFDGLGNSFFFDTITHKFHASCHGTHAMIEALLGIIKKHKLKPKDIIKTTVRVNRVYLDICNIQKPKTGLQAKFSFKLIAALIICGYDTANLNTFSDSICKKKSIINICEHVDVESDTSITETQAQVKLRLSNRKFLISWHDLTDDISIKIREQKILKKTKVLLGSYMSSTLWKEVGVGSTLPSDWIENRFNKKN